MPSPCPCSTHTQRPQVTAPFWAGSERGQHQDPPGHGGPSDRYPMAYPHVTRGKQVERRGKTHRISLPEPPPQSPRRFLRVWPGGAGTRGQGSGDLHPHPSAGLQGPPQPQPPLKPLLGGGGYRLSAGEPLPHHCPSQPPHPTLFHHLLRTPLGSDPTQMRPQPWFTAKGGQAPRAWFGGCARARPPLPLPAYPEKAQAGELRMFPNSLQPDRGWAGRRC